MGFAFSRPSYTVAQPPGAGQGYYQSAVAVWKYRLGIDNAINRLSADIRGDQGTAQKIESFLNTVNDYIRKDGRATSDELAILRGYVPHDLIPSYELTGINNKDLGDKMEEWLDKVFQQAIGANTSFITGGDNATSGVRIELGEMNFNIDVSTGSINLTDLSKKDRRTLEELMTNDVKNLYNKYNDQFSFGVEKIANSQTSKVFLYQLWKQQKADLNTEYQVEGDFQLESAAALLANHTYSVKNYTNLSKGVHLGAAKNNKDLFSIYSYFAGDNSLANAARFVFSSGNSHDPATINLYQTWASALYELTGLGTVSGQDLKSLRLVDFLIVQSGGYIRVYSTKEFLRGFPSVAPNWFNPGSSTISSTFFNDSSFVMGAI